MANHHGDFIWYELLTSDADAAARFYGAVTGWQTRAAQGTDRDYRIFGSRGEDVGGLMALPADAARAGMRPTWLGYVAVDNVDATADEIVRAGGTEHMQPTDIPGIGRFAMLADPQGVPFYVMRGVSDGTSTAFDQSQFGHCHWNELATSDPTAALAFYQARFGWEKGDAMPMGEMGEYRFLQHRGQTIGAVMKRMPEGPPPAWMFYFGTEDIDAAAKAVPGNGGTIHYGPAEVPGGVFIIVASDPQGALFGLVGPRKS
ncbi:VOC family protein [Microvirga lotononidis]|uniref:Lactoylglutathione lyase family protein n=1 Tax=Microvirga lotononidis TaxID=864069 RepID=I4YVI3_9HYPH|nr:VOC family protein [Microvirga lotononidis]EIM27975.1 lactoylglutathione lyase family protein [Microvirga lotononidis]WQO27906.1 VOC family protein [Microvirga lotononidis]